ARTVSFPYGFRHDHSQRTLSGPSRFSRRGGAHPSGIVPGARPHGGVQRGYPGGRRAHGRLCTRGTRHIAAEWNPNYPPEWLSMPMHRIKLPVPPVWGAQVRLRRGNIVVDPETRWVREG